MLFRAMFALLLFTLLQNSAIAAKCLDVFPSAFNQATTINEQLTNFPINNSLAYITNGTTLPRGDNYYLGSSLDDQDEISVADINGSEATARLFFRGSVTWSNVKINQNGNPEDLVIIVDGALSISGDDTVINAIVYIKGQLIINDSGTINGALTSIGSGSSLANYNAGYINNADFNGMCEQTTQPIAEYRFDECSYSGLAFEVVDQTGNFSGRSYSNLSTLEEGQVERAANIYDENQYIETSIPTYSDFSITTWFKKPDVNSGNQFLVLGAMSNGGGDLLYLDRYNNYQWGIYNGTNPVDGQFEFGDLAPGWHHLALVYENNSTTLFVNGEIKDSINSKPTGTLQYIGTSFDEINTSTPQGFRTNIDEFKVYDQALSISSISDIYAYELGEKNYDGSTRAHVSCTTSPIAEYRFDETSYDGSQDEVVDSIGSFHGQSFSVQPIAGKVCNAADLSTDGASDYLKLDENVLTAKTDFTVSLWAQTDNTSSQSALSGAGPDSSNEMIMLFSNSANFLPFLKGSQAGNVPITSIADNNWHHLVWTREGTENCFYRNNVLQGCKTLSSSSLNIQSLIIGQEQDNIGGGFSPSQDWEGLIDELLVYDSAISTSEITKIYNNQNSGLGFDGSSRTCPVAPPPPTVVIPVAEYRFDETTYAGVAGEVIDSSGNGYHGRMIKNTELSNALPALSGNPGTCGYASQNDGALAITGLPLDGTTNGVKTTVTFWMNWDGTDNAMPIGWDTHDIWLYEGSFGFNTGASDQYGVSSAGLANGWHHIAVEFTNGSVTSNRMYIDGVEQVLTQRRNSPNNTKAYVDSELRIGGWSRGSGYEFHGEIDEVRIYRQALTTPQVVAIMAERNPCPAKAFAEYRFDELSWDGTPNEVLDNSGSHHGVATAMTTTASGKVCSAGDFTTTGKGDYLSLANTATDGLDDFTVSVWATKGFTHTGTILSGANSGQQNEMIMFFPGNSTFLPYIKSSNVSLSSGGIGDGNWHHLVWTRTGTNQCYYVDGVQVQCGTINNSDSLDIDAGGLIIGQEQDSLGGSFDESQAWDGLLDELIIFNSALPESQINSIYANQNAGNNYDGSARICPTPAIPLAEYRLEEVSWDGTSGEIIDNTGNGHHGQVIKSATPENATPAISSELGTCGYGNLNDGSIQITGLPLDTSTSGIKTTVTFWMNWDNTNDTMPIGWDSHNIWIRDGSIGFNTFNGDLYGTSSEGLANGWHHIAVEFTNGNVANNRMYIDGVEQVLTQRRSSPNNTNAFVNSEFRIGGVSNSTSYNFHGLLDEVRIYESVLTSAQVNTIMTETHPCKTIHHFEINHDGQGLTCLAESVTIKACSDAACTRTNSTPTDVQLFANGVLKNTVTVTGETSVNLSHLVAETITLSLDKNYTCKNGSSTSCDINYANAGFVLDINSTADISSCDTVNFEIKAVKLSDSGVSCAPAFTGGQDLDFSFSYSNPLTGSKVPLLNGTNMANAGQNQTRTISFDANGVASIPVKYDDAGTLDFTVSEKVSTGVSSALISKDFFPSKIVLTATKSDTTLLNNSSSSGTPKQVAASDFNLAFVGQCSDDTETLNYQPQSTSAIEVAVRQIAPSSNFSVLGELKVGTSTTIDASVSTDTNWQTINTANKQLVASYNEVGVISVNVKDTNYLGNVINADSFKDIGRFYPSHFDVTVTDNSFENTCSHGVPSFTYVGQPFGYLNEPVITITAKNALGITTQNYTEPFFQKLIEENVERTFPLVDSVKNGIDNLTKMVVAPIPQPGSLTKVSNGVLDYEFSSSDSFTYTKDSNSEVSEFAVNYDILINSITDSDGVAINTEITTPLLVQPSNGFMRFGRLILGNSFGPETSPLAQPFKIEYLNTSGLFELNTDDNCSSITKGVSNWKFRNPTNNVTINGISISGLDSSLINGEYQGITLSSGENQGKIDIEYITETWLKYNWSNKVSNLHEENPSATATFGVYRGNDRIISWREVGN